LESEARHLSPSPRARPYGPTSAPLRSPAIHGTRPCPPQRTLPFPIRSPLPPMAHAPFPLRFLLYALLPFACSPLPSALLCFPTLAPSAACGEVRTRRRRCTGRSTGRSCGGALGRAPPPAAVGQESPVRILHDAAAVRRKPLAAMVRREQPAGFDGAGK